MKKDVTLETIEDNFLAFHPVNFEKKLNNFLNKKIIERPLFLY